MKLPLCYPAATRGILVVWGQLVSAPFGGMVWQVLHHLAGLRRLGFDVWYVEDSDRPLAEYHRPRAQGDPSYDEDWDYRGSLELVAGYMEAVGLGERWVYRVPGVYDRCHGARDIAGLHALYREADAVFNLCGSQELRDEHAGARCLVYLETDPVKNQVAVASGDVARIAELDAYHFHFTYGANLGAADCPVPVERYTWHPTRPPVCVDWWLPGEDVMPGPLLTSIANWKHQGKDVVWQDAVWRWSKHHEFMKFIDLPLRSALPLELAVGAISPAERERLRRHGWRTSYSHELEDAAAYRRFVRASRGEFTVAKEQYTCPRTGWFSDRSVCYLAAGRPVVTQDTAFSKTVPTGLGLFDFATVDDALAGIEAVAEDYPRHSAAALAIAREYFDAGRVLGDVLGRIGLA